jgi:DNA-binding response OmpR family regulator
MQTILIVDDEARLRQSLAMILQHRGYLVTTAGQAEEARQYLRAGAFDLAILDLKMPQEDGLMLLAEIHASYPEMPVFILTAHASLESAIEAMRHGVRDYLLKPLEPEAIISKVDGTLAKLGQPRRRREIASQLQKLIDELHALDSNTDRSAAVPGGPLADPCRFLQRGAWTLDLHTHRIALPDRQVALAPSIFAYLVTLVRHAPEPVSYETLVKESQGYQVLRAEARQITRRQVHELREALEEDIRQPRYIITMRDFGYRLVI